MRNYISMILNKYNPFTYNHTIPMQNWKENNIWQGLSLNTIYNMDCIEGMKLIPDGSIDAIITSPPYNIWKEYNEDIDIGNFIRKWVKKIKKDGIFIRQVGNRIEKWFIEPIDISTHSIFKEEWFSLVNRIVWSFWHGLHAKKRLSGRYEVVCIYTRNNNYTFNLDDIRIPQKYPNKRHYKWPKKWQLSGNPLWKNPWDVWDISNIKNNHPEKTSHPCQFPEQLINKLLLWFTNEWDIILDPFIWSWTTAIACINTNRNYIWFELDENYWNIANKRIQDRLSEK